MYGSSASNEYGSGGTVKATGFSSRVRFESELFAVSARKRPGAAFPVPSNPAPAIPVFHKKLRRFMRTSAARRANRPARGDYTASSLRMVRWPEYSAVLEVSPKLRPTRRKLPVRQRFPAPLLDVRRRPP